MTTALEANKIKWIEESDIYHVIPTGQNDSEKRAQRCSFPLYLCSVATGTVKKKS